MMMGQLRMRLFNIRPELGECVEFGGLDVENYGDIATFSDTTDFKLILLVGFTCGE